MCPVDVNVVQHNVGILNELSVQEENPNAQAQALPARESQGTNARNFLQGGNTTMRATSPRRTVAEKSAPVQVLLSLQ